MNTNQAKRIAITEFLLRNGYYPTKENDREAWYHSPLNPKDTTPSFIVYKEKNFFKCFSTGEGGTLIDLGLKLYNCSISDFLKKLEDFNFIFRQQEVRIQDRIIQTTKEKKIALLQIKPITNIKLISYADSRGIPIDILTKYCDEIHFTINNKKLYAIGFYNKSASYELRNSFYKGCISPKDNSLIENEITSSICIFEGFFDFLSFFMLKRQFSIPPSNFLILNSASMINKAIKNIDPYKTINLFLDNDAAGKKIAKTIKTIFNNKEILDWSISYKDFKDLNDFLINQK